MLEDNRNDLGMPRALALGGGLLELRVRGKQEVRAFYVFVIGKRIYLLHTFVKMTQTEVAEKAGISRTVIARLESGTTNPPLGTVNRAANILGKELKLVVMSR
jgi:phage-related protein